MNDSRIRSRLKAQLTKFSSELCAGLSKPLGRFVSQMLFGIQSSQDVKLSNIGRSLQEETSLIRTEKRLSRNLMSAELDPSSTPADCKLLLRRELRVWHERSDTSSATLRWLPWAKRRRQRHATGLEDLADGSLRFGTHQVALPLDTHLDFL